MFGFLRLPAVNRGWISMAAFPAPGDLASCRQRTDAANGLRHSSTPQTGIGWQSFPPAACSTKPAHHHRLITATASASFQPRLSARLSQRSAHVAAAAAPAVVAARSDVGTAEATGSATAGAPPQRRGFRLAPDLVACLRRFNGLRAATLQDFTDVQTQLHLGANKAIGDLSSQPARCVHAVAADRMQRCGHWVMSSSTYNVCYYTCREAVSMRRR